MKRIIPRGNGDQIPSKETTMKKAFFLAVSLCFGAGTSAQTFRGGIQGTVTDSTGASIAGADVTVKSADTGLVRTVKTDDEGNYLVTELPLGP